MIQVFRTRRLNVFSAEITPTPHNTARRVFVAFRTDDDLPMVCATAVVMEAMPFASGVMIDWLEVTSEYRREGFATEFLDALIAHYDGKVEFYLGNG